MRLKLFDFTLTLENKESFDVKTLKPDDHQGDINEITIPKIESVDIMSQLPTLVS